MQYGNINYSDYAVHCSSKTYNRMIITFLSHSSILPTLIPCLWQKEKMLLPFWGADNLEKYEPQYTLDKNFKFLTES